MDNLDKDLVAAYEKARIIAAENGNSEVLVEHLFLPLLQCKSVKECIEACGGRVEDLEKGLKDYLKEVEGENKGISPDDLQPSRILQTVFQRVSLWFNANSHAGPILPTDVLKSVTAQKDENGETCWAKMLMDEMGIRRFDVTNWISNGQPKKETQPRELAPAGDVSVNHTTRGDDKSPLNKFGENLVQKAAQGKIDPLIGRDQEVQRSIQILSRRRKNNPIFVGDSGVGKSALAEGLALRIHEGDVPPSLKDKQIISLAMSALVAGCRFRGDFEERMQEIVDEVKSRPEVIVFFDEIHTMVSTGAGGSGAMDAGNILKPALERGEFRCIGATTFKEYRKHFEKEDALARRFQKVDVPEPSIDETKSILKGLRSKFEDHHNVSVSDDIIELVVSLAKRYLANRKFPDKAVDILDEAGAIYSSGIKAGDGEGRPALTSEDIEQTVSFMANVPITSNGGSEAEFYQNFEGNLKASIFGQGSAVKALVKAIKVAKAELNEENKPLGSFLFVGPTGVGKTELTKEASSQLGTELVRFDMSEYMEKQSVAKLIGAPPGYVGYDSGGLLTEAVQKNPYCVLLLDEIEKAHPDIFNVLLQVMDEGHLTDSQGRPVSFKNVLVIMTSNAGATDMAKPAIGFKPEGDETPRENEALNDTFAPEFRNRLDAVVNFVPLKRADMSMIIEKQMALLEVRLANKNVLIDLDKEAMEWLCDKGYDRAMGARPLKRVIKKHIMEPLAEEILHGALLEGGTAYFSLPKGSDELSMRLETSVKQIEDMSA